VLHRVLPRGPANGKVAVLQHGLMDTSATWVLNDRQNSLGYILSDAGFDVWLANSRGNRYTAALDASKAWSFDFDEMAYFDIPATITYVSSKTGGKKLSWVAHSQGCAISFAAFAKPGYSALIERFMALAPVTYLKTQSSPLMKLMVGAHLDTVLGLKAMKFVPSGPALSSMLGVACKLAPGACDGVASGLFGCTGENLVPARTGVYFAHFPDGTSTQNIVHWIRNARSGVFANMQGAEYDLSAYAVPTLIYHGTKDMLADPTDVQLLAGKLGANLKARKTNSFSHMDFTWSTNSALAVYPATVRFLSSGQV